MGKASFQLRMLFILAAIIGAMLVPSINLQLNPSPRVQKLFITFSYPNTGPAEVERQVTSILESVLSRLEDLTEITSTSGDGQGQIDLAFSEDADMADVRLNVSVLIRQTFSALPEGVSYPEITYRSKFETKKTLLSYALLSDLPGIELEQVVLQKLIIPLGTINGVFDVSLRGLQKDEYQIEYNQNLLATLNIEEDALASAIRNWNQRHFIGTRSNSSGQSTAINLTAQKSYPGIRQDLGAVPIAVVGGRTLTLADLASIRIAPQNESAYYRINGHRSTNMTIYAEDNVNIIRLAGLCREKMKALKSTLPPGIDLILVSDRSEYLASELYTIGVRMLAAMIILLISMVLIYRHTRKVMVVWSGFVICLLISVIIYYFAGLELHLYSLAGLTLSLGIVLDNLIVSADHIYKHHNQQIFVALLAATLTTIGALSIIFFIAPEYREQLTDFAWIFIINVGVSLLVALFYLPAIIKKQTISIPSVGRRRRLVRFNRVYSKYIRVLSSHRWIPVTVLILTFGVPLFLLPNEIKSDKKIAGWYNEFMDGWYGKNIHTHLTKYLGGTLRLFVRRKDLFLFAQTEKQETRLYVRASVPFGGTTEQLNDIIKDFEIYIKSFTEVNQINSFVFGPNSSSIEINFTEAHADGDFPYRLKSLLERKAIDTGSGDFQIYGVGRGFDNELRGQGLTTHLKLLGYNYDQLQEVALQASKNLLRNIRIQKVFINPTRNYFAPDGRYFQLELDKDLLGTHPAESTRQYISYWQNISPDRGIISSLEVNHQLLPVRLVSSEHETNNIWQAQHGLHPVDTARFLRNNLISHLAVRHGENKIVRYNQQYQLFLEYDFIGNHRLAEKVRDQALQEIKAQLPPGYQISNDQSGWWWRQSQDKMTYIVMASLVVIFLVSSILFNSLRQALIPLILVPVSFIGIFLVVHFFDFRFDQGGFTAFLLVAGLSVNAGIFIINDYNNIRKHRKINNLQVYIKAYHGKIIPVLLTVLSTILGLLPFLLFEKDEPFWYSLAICTIAGLVFSVVGVVALMPCTGVFSRQKSKSKTR